VSYLEPGTIFGKDFRIVRPLREGGMGAVYIAEQISTGKERALKVMAAALAFDAATRERFVLEARAGSKIESDHVVEVVTAGVDEATGAPFLVMELLRGEELADAVLRLGPLPLGDVAEVLSQIGHALEQAHALGIVHRDLKPENIFLATSRRRDAAFTAKILDFGIAKLVEDSVKKTGTQPLGTPLYMSPEQTDRKGRISPATDVWALGLITFHLLTARDFWRADDSLANLLREICVDPIPLATSRAEDLRAQPLEPGQFPVPALPGGFDAWFARCVSRDIDARFANAGEAVRAFAQLVTPGATRGKLAVSTGPVDAAALGASAAFGATAVAPMTAFEPSLGAHASARGETAATLAHTTGAKPGGGSAVKVVAAVGVLVLGVGGFFGYRLFDGSAANATATATATSTPTPTPTPASSASTGAATGTCPDGMVLIQGGSMNMGARDLMDGAKPPHKVTLGSFCFDRTEVTTDAYLGCVKNGVCERPPAKVHWPDITPAEVKLYSPLCNAAQKDREEHPINCVAWSMADTFCRDRGARLPTEAEWEYAARGGKDQRIYPWGDDPPGPRYLNACGKECSKWHASHGETPGAMYEAEDGYVFTAPVGKFPEGAAASGAQDLAGNVSEWTADWYGPYTSDALSDPTGPKAGTRRVVRGGAWSSVQSDWTRPAFRWSTDPETFSHAVGFRCAAQVK
jgi:formylglycine-generating enzyme required for sulfatase activity/tRNA A-37 threonylcarbamoyl transferase component Bud32